MQKRGGENNSRYKTDSVQCIQGVHSVNEKKKGENRRKQEYGTDLLDTTLGEREISMETICVC